MCWEAVIDRCAGLCSGICRIIKQGVVRKPPFQRASVVDADVNLLPGIDEWKNDAVGGS